MKLSMLNEVPWSMREESSHKAFVTNDSGDWLWFWYPSNRKSEKNWDFVFSVISQPVLPPPRSRIAYYLYTCIVVLSARNHLRTESLSSKQSCYLLVLGGNFVFVISRARVFESFISENNFYLSFFHFSQKCFFLLPITISFAISLPIIIEKDKFILQDHNGFDKSRRTRNQNVTPGWS